MGEKSLHHEVECLLQLSALITLLLPFCPTVLCAHPDADSSLGLVGFSLSLSPEVQWHSSESIIGDNK